MAAGAGHAGSRIQTKNKTHESFELYGDSESSQEIDIPSGACFWEFSHAKRVGVCFKLADPDGDGTVSVTGGATGTGLTGRRFLQQIVKLKEYDDKWWGSLECFIKGTRMDKFDLDLDAATCSRIHQVFSSHVYGPESRHDGNEELKEEQDLGFWPRVRQQVSDQRIKLSKMYNRAKESQAPYEEVISLHHVQQFLELLADILHRTSCGLVPKEAAFMNLFQRYAQLCKLYLSPGDTITRKMTVLGYTVKSMPDFQFRSNDESRNEFLVITVGECKPSVCRKGSSEKTYGHDSPRPIAAKRCRLSGLPEKQDHDASVHDKAVQHSPRTAHRLSEDEVAIAELGCKLSGQHACDLLLELPHSAMKAYGRGTCMLGLIIEGTKVRLTCLEMKTEHLEKIQSSTEPIDDEEATLHYTRAYDMLNCNDRKHLDYILLTLAFLNPHM